MAAVAWRMSYFQGLLSGLTLPIMPPATSGRYMPNTQARLPPLLATTGEHRPGVTEWQDQAFRTAVPPQR